MSARSPGADDSITITLPVAGTVTVLAFPHDPRFARDIRRAALAVAASATSETDLLRLLQGALRGLYPQAEVRARERLAGLGDDDRVWYAMRDGHVGGGGQKSNRLPTRPFDLPATAAASHGRIERADPTPSVTRQPRAADPEEPGGRIEDRDPYDEG